MQLFCKLETVVLCQAVGYKPRAIDISADKAVDNNMYIYIYSIRGMDKHSLYKGHTSIRPFSDIEYPLNDTFI